MKKILFILVSITLALTLALIVKFALGGSEDAWVCAGGAWVKHGNPTAPMPTEACTAEPTPPGTK